MRINLSKFAGFCDGVQRAFDIVMNLDISNAKIPVFVLGSLVHNPEVVRKIEEKGIRKIEREDFFKASSGEIGTLIITAHGDSPIIFETAKKRGIEVIDVTCPKVIKVQRLAKVFSQRGCKLVIVGDREHKEVRGIADWGGGEAAIVSGEEDLDNLDFEKYNKVVILAQTTQNEDFYTKIAGEIKGRNPGKDIEILSTTCSTTHERQLEVRELARDNEAIIVIGSKSSANSVRLFEIAREINPNSCFIENVSELDSEWFHGISSVGVTAGASTPPWVIEKTMLFLTSFKA